MVGYPRMPWVSQRDLPPAVQSTSATSPEVESLNSSMSLSQSGFSFLQWPHQGARNLMKTVFPETSLSQLASVSSVAAAEASKLNASNFIISSSHESIKEVMNGAN